ncbi:tail protein [Ralstonia phage phiAp1]|uniref:Tail tubular B n=1 Tax=Ralstonia phage phiAp1 TaxID=2783867 RepID=A0A1L7DSB0_9CAUD|nr:tail protein [Ralstonia phage phiAp1]APU03183.1 tail tubular B [Ralstonia phage phiAp1]
MAAFEGSMKSQLQGVSQQIARERLDGQVTAQDNMLSDVVTGLRRRPGAEFKRYDPLPTSTLNKIVGWSTDIGGRQVRLVLNTGNGVVRIYDQDWNFLQSLSVWPYLVAADRTSIRATTVGDQFVIANTAIKPTAGQSAGMKANAWQPGVAGFFYVKQGAFDTIYTINMYRNGALQTAVGYQTPKNDGADPDAAYHSSPAYIAQQIATRLVPYGWNATADGAYVFVWNSGSTPTGASVQTPMSSQYIGVSNGAYVQTVTDLPARLPVVGHHFICQVGSLRAGTYYMYDGYKQAWLESAAYDSPGEILNMPAQISYNGTTWTVDMGAYEGSFAGDSTSNPNPSFLTRGITGIGSYQGRLVVLAGNRVCLSASNNSKRFFRSTMEALQPNDTIDIGSSANSSAAYQYAIPFQKDLILFSEKYQALIPGGNIVLTPSNATVVVTSTFEGDMTAPPIPLGRTLAYPAPRSSDFFGVLEMVPSQYTDAQYTSTDVTAHLPKYLAGRCRFAVSSSVANIAVFGQTNDPYSVIVHEYLWQGDQKVQQAWHRWTFPYPVADAFFTGSDINLLFYNAAGMIVATIDPRIGTLTAQIERRPFLDLYKTVTVAGNVAPVYADLLTFDPTAAARVKLADVALELMGEEIGIESRGTNSVVTVPSFESGPASMGIPYRSSFSPTTVMVKDQNGVVISSNRLTLLRYMVGTANSYEYEAVVQDTASDDPDQDQTVATLYWGSAELDLERPRVSSESIALIPCRTAAETTTLVLFTDGLGEMNIVSLEYVCRYNQKLRRR